MGITGAASVFAAAVGWSPSGTEQTLQARKAFFGSVLKQTGMARRGHVSLSLEHSGLYS